jgi:hypothetical protein
MDRDQTQRVDPRPTQEHGAEGVVRLQFGAEMDARPQQIDSATASSVARWHYGPSPRGPWSTQCSRQCKWTAYPRRERRVG